jgi:hypothetical protein
MHGGSTDAEGNSTTPPEDGEKEKGVQESEGSGGSTDADGISNTFPEREASTPGSKGLEEATDADVSQGSAPKVTSEIRLPGTSLWRNPPEIPQVLEDKPEDTEEIQKLFSLRSEGGGELGEERLLPDAPILENPSPEPNTGFSSRYPVRNRTDSKFFTGGFTGNYREVAHGSGLNTTGNAMRVQETIKFHTDGIQPPADLHPTVSPDYSVPMSWKKMCEDPYSYHWRKDCDREIRQFMDRAVFEWADLPVGKTPLTGHWVYVVKRNLNGTVEKFKSRFVVHGNKSKPGLHYTDTFAPTAESTTARVLLSLATVEDWEADQMDVSAAFLYGPLDEEIYMVPPPGYGDGSNRVWRLTKALYGLKQAPRQWNSEMSHGLATLGFVQSALDPALYTLKVGSNVVYLLDFVDDMLMFSPSRKFLDGIKLRIAELWEVTDLGPAKKYLGWHIRRNRLRRRMWLTVDKKIKETVREFGAEGCEPKATPLPSEFFPFYPHEMDLSTPERQPEPDSGHVYSPLLDGRGHKRYMSLVGSLQYFASSLRPDVAFAANALAQTMHCPRERHWKAAIHCLKYLSGTPDLALHYAKDKGSTLIGFSDSDFAGCKGTRKSTTGFIFTLAGGPISWKIKKQEVITLSSCEAEYRALTSTVQECMWLRELLSELGWRVGKPTPIYCDNEAAVRISKDPVNRARTKHAALSFLFVREQQKLGTVNVIPVSTKAQVADYLTKAVSKETANMCKDMGGQRVVRERGKGEGARGIDGESSSNSYEKILGEEIPNGAKW